MNKIKRFFVGSPVLASVVLFGAGVTAVFAQAQGPIQKQGDLVKFFCNIIDWFIWILIAISIIMVLVGAFDYITAGDDTEKVARGRKRLTYAAIGIAITLLAYGFPAIVASVLPNNASANAFTCGSGSSGSSFSSSNSSAAGYCDGEGFLPNGDPCTP